MSFSRRSFMKWAASVSTLAVGTPSYAQNTSAIQRRYAWSNRTGRILPTQGYRLHAKEQLPSQKEVWGKSDLMATNSARSIPGIKLT